MTRSLRNSITHDYAVITQFRYAILRNFITHNYAFITQFYYASLRSHYAYHSALAHPSPAAGPPGRAAPRALLAGPLITLRRTRIIRAPAHHSPAPHAPAHHSLVRPRARLSRASLAGPLVSRRRASITRRRASVRAQARSSLAGARAHAFNNDNLPNH